MDDKSWNAVKAAYEEALGLPTDDLRPPGGSLTPEDSATLGFMLEVARTHVEVGEACDDAPSLHSGDLLGPFLIRKTLGEGGMGSVFLAEQMSPIRRTVALKVIRADLSSPQIARRFEAERQSLALMEHPGIAKVLEADSGPDGSPYFAMEYVDGVAIDIYCDEQRLSVRERVELMVQVCDAIEHAHRRGVIHRDLKPNNLMIGQASGRAQAKVIDFGIAKALSTEMGPADLTGIGRIVGTPFYMSPEQIEGQPLDVRSDVWALSMVLYQLVAGTLPYPDDLRQEASPVRRLLRMREEDIVRPSTRFSRNSGENQQRLAEARRTSIRDMERHLRNDLDWILLKGLAEDREERYGSVTALKEDLQRYLVGEAVRARPADRLYLLRKFVSRHRLAVVAAGITLAALLAGTLAATLGLLRARQAEQVAAVEASTASAINEFLIDMLSSADPHEGSRDIQVSEILEAAANGLDGRFMDQPAVRVELLETIGLTFHHLGRTERGIELLQRGLAEAKQLADRSKEFDAAVKLGEAYGNMGRIEEALEVTAPVVAETTGTTDRESLLLRATALNNVAVFHFHQGRGSESLALLEEAVEIRTSALGQGHEKTLGALSNLVALRSTSGATEELLADLQDLLARKREALGARHPSTLATMESLGTSHGGLDHNEVAESLLRENYQSCLEVFGAGHRRVGIAASALGSNLLKQRRYIEALPILEEATEILIGTIDLNSDFAIAALENEALVLTALGRNELAESKARAALDSLEATFPEDLGWKAGLTNTLADSMVSTHRAESLALYETATELDLASSERSADHGRSWLGLAEKLIASQATGPRALEASQAAQADLGSPSESESMRRARVAEAGALSLLGRHEEALRLFSELLGPPQAPSGTSARELVAYGDALARAGQNSGPCLRVALRAAEETPGKVDAWRIHRDLALLGGSNSSRDWQEALRGCSESLGGQNPACLEVVARRSPV